MAQQALLSTASSAKPKIITIEYEHHSEVNTNSTHPSKRFHRATWVFTKGGNDGALTDYPAYPGDVIEWHCARKFWFHTSASAGAPWKPFGTNWGNPAEPPCFLSGSNHANVVAGQGTNHLDWVVRIEFPANGDGNTTTNAYHIVVPEDATLGRATTFQYYSMVEATLVWEGAETKDTTR